MGCCEICGSDGANCYFNAKLLCKKCYLKSKGIKKNKVKIWKYSAICFGKTGQVIKII